MSRPTISRSLWSFLFLAGTIQTYGQGPVITLTPTDYNGFQVSCFGLKDGAIDATVTGGTEPYSYAWSNGATTEDLANVPAGYYVLRVSDANSNTTSLDITLDQPMPLKIAVEPFKYPSGVNISCHECFNGSIDVTV
ncbi:MAG: SprB repeat-containing protein [Flavobacteriales bacterium]|nr:SprB repeat-containing protein [Flavobacteriales bacterium]